MVSIRLSSRRKSSEAEAKETTNETLDDEHALDLSVRSLNTKMIRTRTANVFDYYKEVKTLGEGSIGSVVLVRRRKGTEGGSAYSHQDVDKGCFGFLSCLPRRRRPRTLEKRGPRALLSNHSSHAKEYALKSIHLRLLERKYLDELRNEINVMRSLDHPNIVKAYEVYETETNIYVLMEYCSGGDLYSRAPYTETEAAKIVSHLCSAISHMHKNGCVHRDLKFENIMFESKRESAQIQVLDFGLSKRFLPGASKTMTEWVGTIYTMAPEVLNGFYDAKADLWSIGVITFILLCDQKPFKARVRAAKIEEIRRAKYTFDAPRWQHVSKEAIDFVSSLLIRDPGKRPTAEEAVQHPWLKLEQYPNRENEMANQSLRGVSEHILNYARTNELKRIACSVVAHKSSEEEIIDLRKAFDRFDYKKDGVISLEEFRRALSNLNYTSQEITDMFCQMDVNQNGVILYTEFLAATLEMRGDIEEKRLAEAFDHMDDDDSGYISKENLMQLLGENVTNSYIEKLIEEVDKDGDGRISFEEFFSMFRHRRNAVSSHK